MFVGVVPASYFFYSISRPGAEGSPSSLTKWLQGFDYFKEESETRNAMRTQMIEQAAHDRHLFLNARRNPHIDLKTPEYVPLSTSHPTHLPVHPFIGGKPSTSQSDGPSGQFTKKLHRSIFPEGGVRFWWLGSWTFLLILMCYNRLLNSGAPWNVPAGHRGRNLEEATEHYRKQHVEEEDRKVQKLAEKAQKSASS